MSSTPPASTSQLTPRAVILGLEHPRAVATITSLGQAGISVVGVDYRESPRAFASRYLKEKHRIPFDDEQALAALLALGVQGGGVLIPTSDEYLILVSKNADALSEHFVLTVPTWDILGPLMDIGRCYEVAAQCGIRTPAVFEPQDEEELREVVGGFDLENAAYVLKTPLGTVPADPKTQRFTRPAGDDAASILANCREIAGRLGALPLIVEVIPGQADQCIGVSLVVDQNHEIVAGHCIRRLTLYTYSRGASYTHPYELGANVYCESIRDDEAMEEASHFVRHARYSGAITVEFRRDPRDGALVLIKADTRVVRATSLSMALGADLPLALYRTFTGGRYSPQQGRYREGACWIWLSLYLSTLWNHRGDRKIRGELFSLARRLHRVRAIAYGSMTDPMPLLYDLSFWLRDAAAWGPRRILRRLR